MPIASSDSEDENVLPLAKKLKMLQEEKASVDRAASKKASIVESDSEEDIPLCRNC